MKIQTEICVCDGCGNEWIAETDEPERCPSRKCRKRSWDRSGIRLGVDEQFGFGKPEKILKTKPGVRASKVRKLAMSQGVELASVVPLRNEPFRSFWKEKDKKGK